MATSTNKAVPHVGATTTPTESAPSPERVDGTPAPLELPDESNRASHLVKVGFPHSSFAVEGVPLITAEGTRLTKGQLETAQKVAPSCDVVLEVEELS